MQLDFFQRLLAPVNARLRRAKTLQKPTSAEPSALTQQARSLLHALGAEALASRVEVRWNPRMRSTAGTAFAGLALITLNPRLRDFGDEELERTLKHELAHLLAHERAGRRRIAPHGREWRQACYDFGLAHEKRCHELPFPRRQMKVRHRYRCPSCAVELRRVRPLRGGSACLACCRAHNRGRYDERFRFQRVP